MISLRQTGRKDMRYRYVFRDTEKYRRLYKYHKIKALSFGKMPLSNLVESF